MRVMFYFANWACNLRPITIDDGIPPNKGDTVFIRSYELNTANDDKVDYNNQCKWLVDHVEYVMRISIKEQYQNSHDYHAEVHLVPTGEFALTLLDFINENEISEQAAGLAYYFTQQFSKLGFSIPTICIRNSRLECSWGNGEYDLDASISSGGAVEWLFEGKTAGKSVTSLGKTLPPLVQDALVLMRDAK